MTKRKARAGASSGKKPKTQTRRTGSRGRKGAGVKAPPRDESLVASGEPQVASQPFLDAQLTKPAAPSRSRNPNPLTMQALKDRLKGLDSPVVADRKSLDAANRIKTDAGAQLVTLPQEIKKSLEALRPPTRRFHGSKFSLAYFPGWFRRSPCADKFGYLSPAAVRNASKLPFDAATQALLEQLGGLMADAGREASADTNIPAGFTYVGQFVDHDITLDVSSSLEVATDANTIHNMRSPALDLDSVYGRGPALDPFLYVFPTNGNATAIKMLLGTNRNVGPGGPAGSGGTSNQMQTQVDFDVPRVQSAANTAIIGDPRNDENLIIVQLHQTMLRFHNAVVDLLLAAGFAGDVFIEAKRIVTHHYQWAVVHDFLKRICGAQPVTHAMSLNVPINSPFRMPVEFAVAAYRFGHSMIRDNYWVNFNFPAATMGQVFAFSRPPNLPVLSNWVVDFNAFFETGVPVPVNNKARKIDSVLANQLESLPGFAGMMAILATRNLRRGLALGLPSGQGMAGHFGVPALTEAQLTQGLPANEVAVLQSQSKLLLKKTPLWYYVLREAAVVGNGDRLGPVGGRIVAETVARILKRDPESFVNSNGGFTPMLPAATPNTFTFADLVTFAGVTQP